MPAFNHFVVLVNPASTNAARVEHSISELRRMYPAGEVVVRHTLPTEKANRRQIARWAAGFRPGTLLCIGAGDGTVNLVVEVLLQAPGLSAEARRTPILPLWGGNANDLACMLNGPAGRQDMHSLLTKGEVVPIHPLVCRLASAGGQRTHKIAICYASFGATAFAAERLNRPRHRNNPLHRLPGGRFLSEFAAGFAALMGAPTFRVREADDLKVIYERTFTNGSRFAKIDRLPLRLTDQVFYLHTLENKRLLSVLPRLAELMQKRYAGKFLHNHATFTLEEATLAQFDGETVPIAAGTSITVELSTDPFYAYSTRLKSRGRGGA